MSVIIALFIWVFFPPLRIWLYFGIGAWVLYQLVSIAIQSRGGGEELCEKIAALNAQYELDRALNETLPENDGDA